MEVKQKEPMRSAMEKENLWQKISLYSLFKKFHFLKKVRFPRINVILNRKRKAHTNILAKKERDKSDKICINIDTYWNTGIHTHIYWNYFKLTNSQFDFNVKNLTFIY